MERLDYRILYKAYPTKGRNTDVGLNELFKIYGIVMTNKRLIIEDVYIISEELPK